MKKNVQFAFLVHPRNAEDIRKKYPILRYVPIRFFLRFAKPTTLSYVKGLINQEKECYCDGEIISLPMLAEDMLKNKERAFQEMVRAIKVAKNKGIQYIGLGALTSSVSHGGRDIVEKYGVYSTNGNALTVAMTLEGIKQSAKFRDINLKDARIAIVGATGSIGQAVARLLVQDEEVKNITIIGKTQKNIFNLKEKLLKIKKDISVEVSMHIQSVQSADIIVMATSSSKVILTKEYPKRNAIIYDITQPQNIPKSLKNDRSDVLVVDGAIVQLPNEVEFQLHVNLPPHASFACLAETMIIAAEGMQKDFSIGNVTIENVQIIQKLAKKYNIKLAPLRSWGELI